MAEVSSGSSGAEVSLLPVGTVAFLFTDMEGSTPLLARLGHDRYAVVLEKHQALLKDAAASKGGAVVGAEGDGMLVAFSSARSALDAAVAAQRALAAARWGDDISIRVRMGVDIGEVVLRAGTYVGVPLHRGARVCQAARGGQVLLSAAARALVGTLPDALEARDLGAVALEGFAEPEQLFQVLIDGLPDSAVSPLQRLRREGSLLEREADVAALEALVADTRRGSGGVVVVEGPAGIGKSSLLESARACAEDAGLLVLGARGGELEVDYPFGVVRQLFEPLVTRGSPDADALFSDRKSTRLNSSHRL